LSEPDEALASKSKPLAHHSKISAIAITICPLYLAGETAGPLTKAGEPCNRAVQVGRYGGPDKAEVADRENVLCAFCCA
jgi:hypothetical protein